MSEIKIGQDVMLHGKIIEIIISEKETLYKVEVYPFNEAPNLMFAAVIMRAEDIVDNLTRR